ncbi:hypothetical protein OY671_003586, partial [Metschnikowia pulcherrima]
RRAPRRRAGRGGRVERDTSMGPASCSCGGSRRLRAPGPPCPQVTPNVATPDPARDPRFPQCSRLLHAVGVGEDP